MAVNHKKPLQKHPFDVNKIGSTAVSFNLRIVRTDYKLECILIVSGHVNAMRK